MNKKQFIDHIPDYILGQLNEEQSRQFEQYLNEHEEAKAEMASWQHLEQFDKWQQYEPSLKMDDRFYQSLDQEIEKANKRSERNNFWKSLFVPNARTRTTWTLSMASILLILGFLIGSNWYQRNQSAVQNDQLVVSGQSDEVDDVRAQLVMSLVDQPYATKRLQAITEVNKLNEATEQVILALFKMLNSDPNVNVRLASVSSLSNYVENPMVREGLVRSITKQESPLVQIALAELMVTLQEQDSIDPLEEILKNPNTNDVVKQKLEESINQII